MNSPNLQNELNHFLELMENESFFKRCDYCYANSEGELDLLITGLIHGDEVIGIQIINRFLEENNLADMPIKIGFLLGNIDAYRKNVRYVESDLNRSFASIQVITLEHKRALEIASIVQKAKYIIDIHQTIEPTLRPFFIFPHHEKLIKMANALLPEVPIVTFAENGFSKNGKTMIEYALNVGRLGMAIECGQKGFNDEISLKMQNVLSDLIDKLSSNIDLSTTDIFVNQILQTIDYHDGDELIPGLQSHQVVKKDEVIGKKADGENILSPVDGYIYFPKYGELAKQTRILCEIAVTKKVLF